MADLLGGGVQEHVAVLGGRAARAPGLEEILHADADFALYPADGLLQHTGVHRIGLVDGDWILQPLVVIKHGNSVICL